MSSLVEQQTTIAALRSAERDIDRIVVEHLLCAPDFREWFLGTAGAPELDRAELSVTAVRGGQHTDNGVDIVLKDSARGGAVFVSNRLVPNRRQAEALTEEAARTLAEGRAARIRRVLVRPESVEARSADVDPLFDVVITHDWLRALFETRAAAASAELSRRLAHHAAVIAQAVGLCETVLETMPETNVDDFLHDYLRLVEREMPDMPPGVTMLDGTGPGKVLMAYPPTALPRWPFLPGMRLAHHLQEGAVSIAFEGWGGSLADLAQTMEPTLSRTPYYIALGPKRTDGDRPMLMLVEDVPPVRPERPIAQQERVIQTALRSVQQMRNWLAGQQTVVRYWAEVAGGVGTENRISRFRRDVSLS